MNAENPSVLIIIDVQLGLDDPDKGHRCNPQAETNIATLLDHWRRNQSPIVHVQHDSIETHSKLRAELPGNAFKPEARPLPTEIIVHKSTNSAFVETELDAILRENNWRSLIIAGLTTDHCVSASTRNAADLGYDVTLISDATAAFECIGHDGQHYRAETIHNVNLASLNGEFCRVITTGECLAEQGRIAS
ncbi:MAG: cysteine hydrolase family protein [Pseudomonadota bacterium]